jgi:hypothetical protein
LVLKVNSQYSNTNPFLSTISPTLAHSWLKFEGILELFNFQFFSLIELFFFVFFLVPYHNKLTIHTHMHIINPMSSVNTHTNLFIYFQFQVLLDFSFISIFMLLPSCH